MATLIADAAALKANIAAVDANFTWASIKSYVEDVERDIVSEVIGDDFLTWIAENLDTLNAKQQKVLQLLQRAEAYLAINRWTQTAMLRLTDKALYVVKSSDGAIISDKKLFALRVFTEEEGFRYLDKAIGQLEASLADFPLYRDGDIRKAILQGFIKTAGDFSYQRSIDGSRLTFLSMHALMLEEQEEQLPKFMGELFYIAYKDRFAGGQQTPAELKVLPMIKKAVAYLTIARACMDLPVRITSRGLTVNKFNSTSEYEQADPAEADRIRNMADDTREMAERKLLELQNYLIKNANLFPGYIPPAIDDTPLNCPDDGIIIL